MFVDELDLPKRTDWEVGGAPDQALRDQSRLWMIELKTEAGSHWPTQLPLYLELGRHHYPRHRIEITYLTGPLSKAAPPIADGCRYGHVTWSEVMPLVREIWSDRSSTHRAVVDALGDALDGLSEKWSSWRADRLVAGSVAEPPPCDPVDDALRLAQLTAIDHQQRAVAFAPASLEELQALRLQVLRHINASGDSALLHIGSMAMPLGKPGTTSDRRRTRDRLRAASQLVLKANDLTTRSTA